MLHTYKKRFELLFLTMCVYVCPGVGMHKGVQRREVKSPLELELQTLGN